MTKAVFLLVSLAFLGIAFLAGGVSTSGTSRAAERMMQVDESGPSSDGSKAGMFDYDQPVDPTPISKAVRPGPIEHGTPLIPYLPQPSPPNPPSYSTYP